MNGVRRRRKREIERERGRGCQTETESRRKKGEASGSDIINDFTVVISVFTDLDSSL